MQTANPAMPSIKKSTIGRSNLMQATVRPFMRGLSHVAPRVAADVARRIFLRPPKANMPVRERWWATDAEEMNVLFGEGHLRAWRWGWGSPHRVLLVHGWGGRGLQLGALAQPLVEAGFDVIAFDAPGHGQSSGSMSSLPAMADAVGAIVRHVGGVDGIVAHSFGAAACTNALNQPHMAPAVKRLVFIAPAVDMVGLTDQFADMVGFTSGIASRLRSYLTQRFGVPFESFQPLPIARNMHHPLLVLHDGNDREIDVAQGKHLAADWPGALFEATEGLGHRRILRHPAVVQRTVEFLTR